MGLLKTLAWTERKKVTCPRTVVIDFDNIEYIHESDDGDDGTCMIALKNTKPSDTYNAALHVDISMDQMIAILKEHKKNPDKIFETHPKIEEFVENEISRKTSKKQPPFKKYLPKQ